MASEILTIHHKTPEIRKITKVVEALRNGAVILYPTDTGAIIRLRAQQQKRDR